MLRWLYIRLLFLHPANFRYRFCDEMLEIFDATRGFRPRLRLLADGIVSLLRQWTLRPEFRDPTPAATDVPMFHTFEPYQPSPAALVHGGFLALLVLSAVVVAIGHGGRAQAFLIGMRRPGLGLLQVRRDSVAGTNLDTTVGMAAEPEDPLHAIALAYFRVIRVLNALDGDGNLVLSPWEIADAPAALRRLDRDGDGQLSPEECGFQARGALLPADVRRRARREFMRVNPVLAALDRDHDGVISAAEIAVAARSLRDLDRNGDGSLAADELLPEQAESLAATIMSRFDRDDDGVLSAAEQSATNAAPLRELLRDADRDDDGTVTREELLRELRRRAELAHELEGARRTLTRTGAH